jgi:hypothetical protein
MKIPQVVKDMALIFFSLAVAALMLWVIYERWMMQAIQ